MKTRRHFLKATAATLAAGLPLSARPAASERVTLGVIGLGARGFVNLESFLKLPDTQVVAVCDVDEFHYREHDTRTGKPLGREPGKAAVETHYAKETASGSYKGCATYSDYRELCARDDIDAVVVATPDHWHALNTLEALRGGKDVYCEKPVTHLFAEGQWIVAEVDKRDAIFQTGSQQRSGKEFHQAVTLVRNGVLGKLERVEVGLPAGYPKAMGPTEVREIPANLDYDTWCGPSEVLPYMKARHHRWWRGHRAYGGGNIMDFIGHHNDINHWALGMDDAEGAGGGPSRVEAVGWTWPDTDVYNTPVDYEIRCEYPQGLDVSIAARHRGGVKWIGKDGWLWVTRGKIEASDPAWLKPDFTAGDIVPYRSPGHHRNFIDGVRDRKACVAPALAAHRSITPGHLGYISQDLGRPLRWDAATETVIDDAEAEALLKATPYRKPWQAPG